MASLMYTVIKTTAQYYRYCKKLEELTDSKSRSKSTLDEIDLLIVLIEKWDEDHDTFGQFDPVELLKSIMEDHQLKAKDLSELLQVSKGYISDILHYKKAFSKEITRKLADRFKLRQEVFNRPYQLKGIKKTASRKNKQTKTPA